MFIFKSQFECVSVATTTYTVMQLCLQEKLYCTLFRKAYILSGSGFHKFLYSIRESLEKTRQITEFIPNQLRFHKKKL